MLVLIDAVDTCIELVRLSIVTQAISQTSF